MPFSITGREVYYGGGGAGARYNSAYSSVAGGLGGGGAIGEAGVDGLVVAAAAATRVAVALWSFATARKTMPKNLMEPLVVR